MICPAFADVAHLGFVGSGFAMPAGPRHVFIVPEVDCTPNSPDVVTSSSATPAVQSCKSSIEGELRPVSESPPNWNEGLLTLSSGAENGVFVPSDVALNT